MKFGSGHILVRLLGSLIFGMAGAALYHIFFVKTQSPYYIEVGHENSMQYARYEQNTGIEFITASNVSTPSVVFIKTLSNSNTRIHDDFWGFWDFFGNRGPATNSGSGVIVSQDGYVITNNHVVDKADKIEVVLNSKQTYIAKVIGTDPSTDLALLKIEAVNLKPIIMAANSDLLQIGEWVLAVGNPFNLTSTVTAGIVSAKGRNINVVAGQFPIESFIQTDAAINPGNSGGALVNLKGELVGINTAIASKTGSFNGYGFAIPINIVKKVIRDLREYGEVQRAFAGLEVIDIDADIAKKIGDNTFLGVLISEVFSDGAAAQAGLKAGDVILKVDNVETNSKAMFLERLSYYRPGEKIKLFVKRKAGTTEFTLTLTNKEGTIGVLKNETITSNSLGADFTPLSKVEKQKMGVAYGYRISNLKSGKIASMGLPEGFVILSINQVRPSTIEELIGLLESSRGRLTIEGMHPNGSKGTYSFFMY
ncbi:MAG: trypsin-like peptidase domain-containing protein [Bacteroidia bacterium]|nr:trypsin-like peptidase domain-containing protein [Bacteroidia bacterium]